MFKGVLLTFEKIFFLIDEGFKEVFCVENLSTILKY